jgi:hypothetical protein
VNVAAPAARNAGLERPTLIFTALNMTNRVIRPDGSPMHTSPPRARRRARLAAAALAPAAALFASCCAAAPAFAAERSNPSPRSEQSAHSDRSAHSGRSDRSDRSDRSGQAHRAHHAKPAAARHPAPGPAAPAGNGTQTVPVFAQGELLKCPDGSTHFFNAGGYVTLAFGAPTP